MLRFSITSIDPSSSGPGGLQQMLSALRGGDNGDFQQILSRTVNQGQPGPAPASQETIDALERVQADTTSPPQCPVCFDDIVGTAVRAECSHVFHEDCLLPWLREHGTCPTCRYPIEPEPEPPQPSLLEDLERMAALAMAPTAPRDGHRSGRSSPPSARSTTAASEREVHDRALESMLSAALIDMEHEIEDEASQRGISVTAPAAARGARAEGVLTEAP